MPLHFNVWNIIVLLGSLQGFWLALMFATSKKFNRKSNLFLVFLLLSISVLNLYNGFRDIGLINLYPILEYLPIRWSLLLPFTLYYYFQYLIKPNYVFSRKEYLLIFPFIIDVFFQIYLLGLFLLKSPLLETYKSSFLGCFTIMEGLSLVYCLIVLIVLLKQLNLFQKELYHHYADIENKSLLWLKHIFIAIIVLWGLWAIPFLYLILSVTSFSHYYFYPLWIGLALIVYWLAYSIYARRDLFEMPVELESRPTIGQTTLTDKNVPELSSKTEEHYQNLLQLMEKEKLYQNPNLSMSILAEKTALSNGYLSQIINQKEGKNFFEFVNFYRVEEVKKHLVDEKYAHYSILGIGMEAGFKSKSTFNAVFKKMTGKTPSAYKRSTLS